MGNQLLEIPEDLSEEQRDRAEQQVQVFWQGVPPKILKYAQLFGLIILGWTLRDYMLEAVATMGYETIVTWAERGSGKSNRMLAHGGWLHCKHKYDYEGWALVLKRTIAKPTTFISTLKNIPHGKRIPWLGIDDIGVHMPSTIWRTDIETYQAVDAAWAAIRTKVSVIDVNIPLIDRLAKNIKDSLTFEHFMGKNQNTLIERLVRLPNIYDRMESNFRKLQVEPIHIIDLFEVPTDVFKEYWESRLTLADEALDKLDRILTKKEVQEHGFINLDEWTPALQVASALGISPTTIATLCKDRTVETKVFERRLCIKNRDVKLLEKYYLKKRMEKAKKREKKGAKPK